MNVDSTSRDTRHRRVDGSGLYLLLAVCLVPVLVPMGPGQTAILDPINAVVIGLFLAGALAKRKSVQVPFLVPALLISVGSLIAVFNAVAPGASLLTLAQDAYLYVWFIVLVNVMRGRQEFQGFRVAWVYVADVVAALAIGLVLIQSHASLWDIVGPKGMKATGTFPDTDTLASYLVLSVFLLLSLGQDMGRFLKWGSLALMGTALVATKSNAGITGLAAGLLVWVFVSAWTRHRSPLRFAAGVLLAIAAATGIWWLNSGWEVGSAQIRAVQAESFLGRAPHSSESRFQIWGQLLRLYAKSPQGIGPGNSRWQVLPVEERERPNSQLSKEAHNDYLAYLIERGPLALLGLLALQGQVFARVGAWWRQRGEQRAANDQRAALFAALAGALVAWWVHSLTHETLHSRHYWLFLAMICALEVRGGREGVSAWFGSREARSPTDVRRAPGFSSP